MFKHLLLVSAITYGGCFLLIPAKQEKPPSPTVVTAPAVITAPLPPATTISTSTSTTVAVLSAHDALQADLAALDMPADIPCQEWAPMAVQAGWPTNLLPQLLRIMWRESRCLNITDTHPRHNGWDTGPLQLNDTWRDEIATQFGDENLINDPLTNLKMGWEIYKWHDHHRGCGWEPWSIPC